VLPTMEPAMAGEATVSLLPPSGDSKGVQ
jgi:hypothetical protein